MKQATLIIKSLTAKLTKQEEERLKEWIQESDTNKELYDRIKSLQEGGTDISTVEFWDSETAWATVVGKYETGRVRKIKKRRIATFSKYAAAFIGLLLLGYGYFDYTVSGKPLEAPLDTKAVTLELDSGEVHLLSEDDTEAITNTDGGILGTKTGIRLDYSASTPTEKPIYNTLKVPYGKRFEVALSDATVVYLNAGSSLRYPVRFLEGMDRHVFLTGEAYFDVSTDKERKFKVTTTAMDVTVYGTKFNLSAYPEDQYIQTVLVEGSVGLSSTKTDESKEKETLQLAPGYKAQWDTDTGKTVFDEVDTDVYTGWIEGRLVMKNLSFENIIKKLERRYDLTIENNYIDLNKQVFTASFDIETIDEVLASFSENRPFTFEIKDQTIHINQP